MTNYNALHLIDIENLCGFGKPSVADIYRIREIYEEEVGIQVDDSVIVASGTQNQKALRAAWPNVHHIYRPGKNGADIAIAQFISESQRLDKDFGRVFIGSGDGGLAPYAAQLKNKGLDTIVVANQHSFSFRMNGFERIFLTDGGPDGPYPSEFALCA